MQRDEKLWAEVSRLKEIKWKVKNHYREVAELICPDLMDMDANMSDDFMNSPGHYSGLARTNLMTFAQGMFSYMLGGSADWIEFGEFGNKVLMENRVAQSYFEELRVVEVQNLYDDGFFDIAVPMLRTAAGLGTDVVTCLPSPYGDKADFIHWHPGDFMIGQDSGGRVDRIALTVRTTAHDMADQGLDLSESQRRAVEMDSKQAERKETLVYYYRRSDKQEYLDSRMRWKLTVFNEGGKIAHESPMRSLPGSVWRFFRRDRSAYGDGPGLMLFRDMLQSNKIQKLLMREGELRVNPPMYLPRIKQAFMEPGSENYMEEMNDAGQYPRRMFEPADMTGVFALKQEIDRLVDINLYADFFRQLTGETAGKRKTGLEVQATFQESSAQMTPVVDTFERNGLRPLIRRHLLVCIDQGRIPEPPQIVKQHTKGLLDIEFIGPLAKARRYQYSIGQDKQFIQDIVAPIAQIDQGIIDYVKVDEYLERSARFMGGGRSTIRTAEEVAAIRSERMMQQMAMQQIEAQKAAIGNSKQAEPGSPAAAVMNNG
jgi:hypothetical protein